jgi:glycosyltransferase involved in cell wall biosynthesis
MDAPVLRLARGRGPLGIISGMSSTNPPLVGIVTPVYNGESYLRECIESVLAQTYQNWRYVIVNNCSTDGSLAIARHYAELDPRITVVDPDEHLPVQGSMSRAMSQLDPAASYCKPLMADDWLYPECIEKMLDAALTDRTVGLVCCYAMNGREVMFDTIRSSGGVASFLSGREACRTSLLDRDVYFFGSPTTMLIRADLVHKRRPFYNPANLHVDEESCYDILQESSFCFVHQVLAFIREHSASQTSRNLNLASMLVGRVYSLVKFGPVYLSADEYAARRQQRFREYYGFLAGCALRGAPAEFWRYHRDKLAQIGAPLSRTRLAVALCRHLGARMRAAYGELCGLTDSWQASVRKSDG